MKTFILILCISVLTFCQNEKTKDALILEKFSEVCKSIKHLEYNIERIDTFSSESIRSISGHVLITKENNDKNYGYYFSSECFELNQKSIYDGNNSFDIDTKAKTYRLVKSLKGSPGHQLVLRIADMIFSPDSEYSNVVLLGETNDFYSIEYQYKDDPPITNFRKMILINKLSFLPMEFTISGKNTADRYSYNFILSNLKINENFSSSIEKEKLEFSSYKMLPSENNEMKRSIINLVATNFLLTKLSDLSSMAEIYKGKLTLLDFWEVWCGYCIESMHKIDLLSKKYLNQLDVVGIVTQDSINAIKLINKLGISFGSLIGNKFVLEKYGVDSFPRYFLIDKNGIVKKEYFGFSDQIEKDILEILRE